jgi:exosortase/archaeosortase family protein
MFNNILVLDSIAIDLIPACLALSAYLLFIILNLLTPLKLSKRIKSLSFSLLVLLFFNILRIIFLTYLLTINSPYFTIIHKIIWYFLSTLFVILLWFLSCYLFKIKEIPLYTDLKNLLSLNKNKFKHKK